STTGTYSVKLIVYSNCTNDTVIQTITVNNLSPTVAVSGNSVICKGDNRTYTATGASTYTWTGSASTTSIASLSPTASTVYTVTGFSNGCSSSKVFSVTVEPCQGLSKTEAENFISVFPNPFANELRIDVEKEGKLKLISLEGKIVMETAVQKGSNVLNTTLLKPGLYIAECEQENSVTRFRVVKGD
ncbi:MAG: T9SS type A sorting domain-containing protein, partial [Bacteroidia bacterium]|nr:T9SS type A sorting domain-containing protein [Bacteroidia bacterium]